MFILKKLVTYIILPPGLFILVFIGSGLYLVKRRRRIGYLLIFSGVCLYALSIGPVKDVLMSPLENAFPVQTDVSGDVIVILGSGIENEALIRFMCGHRLWKRLHVPVILTGCGEGGLEKRLLMEMGVDGKDIIEEAGSRDTFENGRYAKEIIDPQITPVRSSGPTGQAQINADLKMKDQRTYKVIGKRGFKAPILVTSPYHMKRAVFLFEKQGMKVRPFPCKVAIEEDEEGFDILKFLPSASVLEESSRALKEYLGLMAARLGGAIFDVE